jgi:hypothetical protein
MTLVISKGITLAKANNGIVDPDAIIYINNVEKADGENLEYDTAKAIHDFVVGCKADGIWNAIKASCILAGARTLTGALVPLVGTAPTNVGGLFVADDYNRKTGLVGNGSTKYLNSNRDNNADPQDSQHLAVSITTADTRSGVILAHIGSGGTTASGASNIFVGTSNTFGARSRNSAPNPGLGSNSSTGLVGFSRATSTAYNFRLAGSTTSVTQDSQTAYSGLIHVFGREDGSGIPSAYTNARLAFYSIGESLDLALLDARVTDLINAFGAAIP